MATERLLMRHIREILRLKWTLRRSHRETARSLGISAGAVASVVTRAKAMALTWDRQKEFRFSSMSNARLRVNVVNKTFLPSGVRLSASHFARCIARTVLPVPAPPSTRTGPLRSASSASCSTDPSVPAS